MAVAVASTVAVEVAVGVAVRVAVDVGGGSVDGVAVGIPYLIRKCCEADTIVPS